MIIERLNENAYISYPFLEDAIMKATDGTEIPNDLLLDMKVDIPKNPANKPSIKLTEIETAAGFVILTFTITELNPAPLTTPVQVILPVLPAGTDHYTSSFVDVDGINGIYAAGRGVNFLVDNFPLTVLEVDIPIEPSCVTNTYNHQVSTIRGDVGDTLTGDVKVVEGYNVAVYVSPETNTLRLSAQVGGGQGMPCQIPDQEQSGDCGTSLFRINGMKPDWYGNFLLQGGPGIAVIPDPDNNKIVIKASLDACEEGCKNE